MSKLSRLGRVAWDYTLGRATAKPSTASFWYLQAPARVHSSETFDQYLRSANPYPLYLFDQTVKLAYPSVNADGVVTLHYGPPVGDQENPEAAFQYALGLADQGLNDPESMKKFIACATHYRDRQAADGTFPYLFDWFESRAPWASALAQARGASVMLRAYLATGDESFKMSAIDAVRLFDLPVADGGFLATFAQTGSPYFEEYPKSPTCVMNGFLSTTFGLWELSHWLKDEKASSLFQTACDSLEQMLPFYSNGWWTLYDLRETRLPNVQSPFYHTMVIEYMKVLCQLDHRPAFKQILADCQAMDTATNRLRATWAKLKFKVAVR